MKPLKLLLVLGLLWNTIDAEDLTEKNVSFSVEKIWQSYRVKVKDCKCTSPRKDDTWKEGVQKHYDGCRTASRLFRGEAYEVADTVVNSFQQYLTKLIYFTNSNSSIISSSSTQLLKTLSRCDKLDRSSMNIIIEFEKIFLIIMEEFNEAAKKLSSHIGELSCAFTNAANDFGNVFYKFLKDFLRSCRLFNCKKKVDFKPVLEKCQILMNTVALIDQTLLNECENEVTQEVYNSVLALHLIYSYMGLSVTGIHSCVLDVLYDRDCPVSKTVNSCSFSFEYALVQYIQAIGDVVLSSNNSIKDLLKIFINITLALNTAVKDILGLFEGAVTTVGDIVKNLMGGDKGIVSAARGQTRILKALTQN